MESTLDDAEESLLFGTVSLPFFDRAKQPGIGQFEGGSGRIFFGGIGSALIKSHDDIGAELYFRVDGDLGGKKVDGAVQVGAELDAVLLDSGQARFLLAK